MKKPTEKSTREILLTAASDIMSEQGAVDVSLNEISERSGLNSALVKYYFGSKSGLMMTLVTDTIGASLERLQELIETDLPPDEKLTLHIRAIVNTYFYHPYVNRLLHHLGQLEDGKFSAELAEQIIKPLFRAEKQILNEGYKAGIFRKTDPIYFYFHVNGACDAMFHSQRSLERAFGIKKITKRHKDRYTEHICDVIMTGIRVK